MFGRLVTAVALAACVAVTTSGCLAGTEVSGNERPIMQPVEPDYEEEARAHLQEMEQYIEPWQPWTCTYSPTYDRDWHNDVICTNGVESERPYLRRGDSFVTQDEIMQSAREYEDRLNG